MMQSHSNNIKGETTTFTNYDSPSFPDTLQVTRLQNAYSKTLNVTNAGVINGDRKSIYPFAYTKDITFSYMGDSFTRDGNSQPPNSRSTHGVISSTVNRPSVVEFSSETYNSAVSDLNSNVRGEIDLSIDLLQGGQTIRMVKSIGRTVELFRALKKGNLQEWYREFKRYKPGSPKAIGSKWLEFQYGWKPLAQTIYDISILTATTAPKHLWVIGKATRMDQGVKSLVGVNGLSAITNFKVSDRCKIAVKLKPPTKYYQNIGLFTSLNPASIAWELIPYSFVVDWFLDIGGYLRNAETYLAYGNLFETGYQVKTFKHFGVAVCQGTNYINANQYVYTDARGGYDRTRYERVKLASYPFPRIPRFKADLGSGRLLNAAALLTQFLK